MKISEIYFKHVHENNWPMKGESDLDKLKAMYNNREEWENRIKKIREGILTISGIKPKLSNKQPIKATIRDKRSYDGYTVSSVFFETLPGFFNTGSLYAPINIDEKSDRSVPGILISHGHFKFGRFEPDNQNLAADFARMGAYAFVYDMVGFGNSEQIDHRSKNAFQVQLWNSIRSLDFILGLPKIDPQRIAITGASGGGTQAMMLSAIDDRIALSAPVVMLSSRYYGGCVCESGIPVHKSEEFDYATNNAEIAAMIAPKPLLIVSCGTDWTRYVPKREFPYIKSIYSFYNAEENVENAHFSRERHNYNIKKRKPVLEFVAKHFELPIDSIKTKKGEIDEKPNTIEEPQLMSVFRGMEEKDRPKRLNSVNF